MHFPASTRSKFTDIGNSRKNSIFMKKWLQTKVLGEKHDIKFSQIVLSLKGVQNESSYVQISAVMKLCYHVWAYDITY